MVLHGSNYFPLKYADQLTPLSGSLISFDWSLCITQIYWPNLIIQASFKRFALSLLKNKMLLTKSCHALLMNLSLLLLWFLQYLKCSKCYQSSSSFRCSLNTSWARKGSINMRERPVNARPILPFTSLFCLLFIRSFLLFIYWLVHSKVPTSHCNS